MDDVAAEQARQNRTTERQWQMYAAHRGQIERLIVPAAPGSKLCVLGAGNCNDLDLRWLIEVYGEVHLVDLDADALRLATERQGVAGSARIHFHAPFDLTNIVHEVAAWGKATPSAAAIRAATARALERPAVPWGSCDVVLSPCVLTQTITPSRDLLRGVPDGTEAAVPTLKTALRDRHLRLIAASLANRGRGVLVIDAVSSEKVVDLARIPEGEVGAALDRLVAARKHFRGLDPASIVAAARGAGLAAGMTPPWLWHLGLKKSFIVYGMVLQRVAKPGPPTNEVRRRDGGGALWGAP